jgi:hypothetical protein
VKRRVAERGRGCERDRRVGIWVETMERLMGEEHEWSGGGKCKKDEDIERVTGKGKEG